MSGSLSLTAEEAVHNNNDDRNTRNATKEEAWPSRCIALVAYGLQGWYRTYDTRHEQKIFYAVGKKERKGGRKKGERRKEKEKGRREEAAAEKRGGVRSFIANGLSMEVHTVVEHELKGQLAAR
jgi:hypothetical protein